MCSSWLLIGDRAITIR